MAILNHPARRRTCCMAEGGGRWHHAVSRRRRIRSPVPVARSAAVSLQPADGAASAPSFRTIQRATTTEPVAGPSSGFTMTRRCASCNDDSLRHRRTAGGRDGVRRSAPRTVPIPRPAGTATRLPEALELMAGAMEGGMDFPRRRGSAACTRSRTHWPAQGAAPPPRNAQRRAPAADSALQRRPARRQVPAPRGRHGPEAGRRISPPSSRTSTPASACRNR